VWVTREEQLLYLKQQQKYQVYVSIGVNLSKIEWKTIPPI